MFYVVPFSISLTCIKVTHGMMFKGLVDIHLYFSYLLIFLKVRRKTNTSCTFVHLVHKKTPPSLISLYKVKDHQNWTRNTRDMFVTANTCA